MSKFLILGKNSFVAGALFDLVKNKEEALLISKDDLDFTNKNTFKNIDFDNSTIIDCVNVNNGNSEEIMRCNVNGFKDFCNYIRSTAKSIKYVYVSTISVLSEDAIASSVYVQSKKQAEEYLISSGIDYHIIRLSYPIGPGENKNRLITRLINNLKDNQLIKINNILINLNDINDVVKSMYGSFFKSKISFISNNKYMYLSDVVFFLKERIGSQSLIEVIEVKEQFSPLSDTPFLESTNIKNTLLKMI